MPHSEPPITSSTLTSHSHSCSKSTLLESYVLEASSLPGPTITTNTTSNDRVQEHPPTTTAGTTTTTAAAAIAHPLSHMHLSSNADPNHPSHHTIHYFRYSIPSNPMLTLTPPPNATTNLHDLRQSLLNSHDLDLLFQEQPLVMLMLDEHTVESIPIEEFLPRPYSPGEAGEHEQGAGGGTVQDGYAIQRFSNTGREEDANVVYARSVVG
ncbi:hypothetical protein C7212DRAFT_363285 [Tuber magnatum]|uniref:Uncharacterized protein n=1 Tax=Tuber magnatum TaxID=42249 RepID=A0A317STK6_9PEZI|nr:hypothetical protein C7212DRAFT_363285 [Tuber magnatum]